MRAAQRTRKTNENIHTADRHGAENQRQHSQSDRNAERRLSIERASAGMEAQRREAGEGGGEGERRHTTERKMMRMFVITRAELRVTYDFYAHIAPRPYINTFAQFDWCVFVYTADGERKIVINIYECDNVVSSQRRSHTSAATGGSASSTDDNGKRKRSFTQFSTLCDYGWFVE